MIILSGAALLALVPMSAFAQEADDDTVVLSEIVVRGSKLVAAGAKTSTPLQEIPNTMTVTTREQLELREINSLEDLMLQTPGVTVTGTNPENPSLISRGFSINNYMIDGVAGIDFPGTTPDLAIYERVEVLRGPAGLFSGAGSPAGSVNFVRKRPGKEKSFQIGATIGSWENYRGEADISVPLNETGSIRARASGAYVDQHHFFDVAHTKRGIIYGIVEADITPKTTIAIGGHYQDLNTPVQTGLPGYVSGGLIDLPRSTYIGSKWNVIEEESQVLFVDLTHQISGNWLVRATAQNATRDFYRPFAYLGNPSVTPTSGINRLGAMQGIGDAEQNSFDAHLSGSFKLFGRSHDLLIGADYQEITNHSMVGRNNGFFDVDIYNPTHDIPKPDMPYLSMTDSETSQYGLYGQARLRLTDPLTIVLGGRYSNWETESVSSSRTAETLPWTQRPANGYEIEGQFTPYAGLVYTINPVWSLYASYADSFTPQSQQTAEGDLIDPITGGQIEGGVKGALFDGRALLSVAAYRITQANRAQADPNYPDGSGFYVASGEVQSTGVEVEVSGRITPDWMIAGGYAYNTNEYTKDRNNVGRPFTAISPEHSLKLWTNYRVREGAFAGWDFGGSLNAFTETVGDNVSQDGYFVVGAQAGYQLTESTRLQFSLNNVFDEVYYTRIRYTRNGNYYGEPRSLKVSIRAKF